MLFSGNSVNSIKLMTSTYNIRKEIHAFPLLIISSSVNMEELSRFVRSLKVLEHCIQPFLNQCDKDNDNKISSDEWGACLGLDKGNRNNFFSIDSHSISSR